MSTPIDTPIDGGHPQRQILLDLMEVGVYVNSVQDLVDSAARFGRARRVLAHHLVHGGHADDVVAVLAQALERSRRLETRVG